MSQTYEINIADLVADKIKVRYAEISDQTFGSSNIVADAYYPTYVRRSLTNGDFTVPNLGKRCSCISPFIANELGLYQIQIEDLTKMLGYKKQDIKAILDTVKAKRIKLALLGLGGTGMNFFHWAEELCHFTNSINVFRNITVYEYDYVDLTNLFRFPRIINPEIAYRSGSVQHRKLDMISSKTILTDRLEKSTTRIESRHLGTVTNFGYVDGTRTQLENPIYGLSSLLNDTVFYGAPDIATREMMLNFNGLKFVSATHGNDDCQLYIRPEQDTSMQIESYGMINLSVFFMNQLKMTISFFELLASNTDLTKSKLVMEYSFAKEYSNDRIMKAGLNRTYNFPINTHNFLDQELHTTEDTSEQESVQESEQEGSSEPQMIAEVFNTEDLLIMPAEAIPAPFTIPQAPPIPVQAEAIVVTPEEQVIPAPVRATATRRHRTTTAPDILATEVELPVAVPPPTPLPF